MKKLPRSIYAIAGVIVLLMAGIIYAWSVMASVINRELNIDQGSLSLTFTLVMITFCLGGLLGGIVGKKTSPRNLLWTAAILFPMGLIISAYTNGVILLYLGFGIISGLGSGIAYNVIMSTVSKWFPDKQGLISGILLMGFGLSSFIAGKLFVYMNPEGDVTSWRSAFKLFAIVIFVLMVILSFFFVLPEETVSGGAKKAGRQPALDIPAKKMMKHKSFLLYYLWAILTTGAGLTIVSQASGMAKEVNGGLSAGTIATIVGILAITNGLGRVIIGALFDKMSFNTVMIIDMATFTISSAALMVAVKNNSVVLLIIGFVLCGIAYGGVPTINSAIISDFFGRTNFPLNYSITNTNLIIASFASTIAGRLYDTKGTYFSVAVLMIIYVMLSVAVSLFIKRPDSTEV